MSETKQTYKDAGLNCLSTYVTDKVKKRWRQQCFDAGLSSSEYLRRLITFEIGEKKYLDELERIREWKPKDATNLERNSSKVKIKNRKKNREQ